MYNYDEVGEIEQAPHCLVFLEFASFHCIFANILIIVQVINENLSLSYSYHLKEFIRITKINKYINK